MNLKYEIPSKKLGSYWMVLILRQNVIKFAIKLDVLNEYIDMNWIKRWKGLHEIVFKKLSGESVDVPEQSVNDWLNFLKINILTKYALENILNCNESVLFLYFTK